jgi:hypothetical protein
MHLLNSVGYATVKNQSKQDALLPLNPIQMKLANDDK